MQWWQQQDIETQVEYFVKMSYSEAHQRIHIPNGLWEFGYLRSVGETELSSKESRKRIFSSEFCKDQC